MELIKIRLKSVADSWFVQQKAWAGGVGLDLLSQLVHEDTQVVGLLHIRGPQTSLRSCLCVMTLPAFLTRTVRSRYSMGVR